MITSIILAAHIIHSSECMKYKQFVKTMQQFNITADEVYYSQNRELFWLFDIVFDKNTGKMIPHSDNKIYSQCLLSQNRAL